MTSVSRGQNQQHHTAVNRLPDHVPAAGPHAEGDLSQLIAAGRSQGYLTFDQVNAYLPDEAVDPEKIDALLVALEEQGIELVDTPPEPEAEPSIEEKLGLIQRPRERQEEEFSDDDDNIPDLNDIPDLGNTN